MILLTMNFGAWIDWKDVLSAALGAGLVLLFQWLIKFLSMPRLRIRWEDRDEKGVHVSPSGNQSVTLTVDCTGPLGVDWGFKTEARECQAFITSMRLIGGESYSNEAVQLGWARTKNADGDLNPRTTIPRKIKRGLAVVGYRVNEGDFIFYRTVGEKPPVKMQRLLQPDRRYELNLIVVSPNAKSNTAVLALSIDQAGNFRLRHPK